MRRVVWGVVGIVGAIGCGSSSTGPHAGGPGISILAGDNQTDTVQSSLIQALVIKVTTPSGTSAAGQVVQFTAVPDTANGGSSTDLLVAPLSSPAYSSSAVDTTNSAGQAAVTVMLGTFARKTRLVIKIPVLGYVDTARYTVTAGAAAAMSFDDTTVYANQAVPLSAAATDRFGNATNAAVSYSVVSGPGTISGTALTVTTFGVVTVKATSGTFSATAHITGVPHGTIAASFMSGTGIASFNLDGSGYHVITSVQAGTVKWSPDGQSLVFDQTQNVGLYYGTPVIHRVTLDGSISDVDTNTSAIDAWPIYSRDGSWVYYERVGSGNTIWRAHPDGSSASVLPVPAGSISFPSVSPNGLNVAYTVYGFGDINVAPIGSGTPTDIGVSALYSQFSPVANVIAFVGGPSTGMFGGPLGIVNSDGTSKAFLTGPNTLYAPQFDWSPDGKWLIAFNELSGHIELISVPGGLVLPLPYTSNLGSPTWH